MGGLRLEEWIKMWGRLYGPVFLASSQAEAMGVLSETGLPSSEQSPGLSCLNLVPTLGPGPVYLGRSPSHGGGVAAAAAEA